MKDPILGMQLANFKVERLLGQGGMAMVYYGQDVKLHRPVASKVLDKRYKNHVDKFNSLSIEAFADSDESKRLRNPKYLGFTFTNNPKLKSAKIVK